jgi:endoribonuclease LACTB2
MAHMKQNQEIGLEQITEHVYQAHVPTPTLPPSFETNTYLIQSENEGLIIDVGSKNEQHLDELAHHIQTIGIHQVVGILVTHYHRDHTEGVPDLQKRYGCKIYVHPEDLVNAAKEMNLNPCQLSPVPKTILLADLKIGIHHVSGHTHGHIHAILPTDKVIFVGDNMAGDGSVWVGPKDGHMENYYEALDHILQSGCTIACPGHGPVLKDASLASSLLKKRRTLREEEIYSLLQNKKYALDELVSQLYQGSIPDAAMWVARKTVQCHLAHLCENKQITISFAIEQERFYYQA